jgi:hypothetical protein
MLPKLRQIFEFFNFPSKLATKGDADDSGYSVDYRCDNADAAAAGATTLVGDRMYYIPHHKSRRRSRRTA